MMNPELHNKLLLKFKEVLKAKSLPMEDAAKMLDILTKTTAFASEDERFFEVQVMNEVMAKLRANSFGIPKQEFPNVLSNLIELQNPTLAEKLVDSVLRGLSDFPSSLLAEF